MGPGIHWIPLSEATRIRLTVLHPELRGRRHARLLVASADRSDALELVRRAVADGDVIRPSGGRGPVVVLGGSDLRALVPPGVGETDSVVAVAATSEQGLRRVMALVEAAEAIRRVRRRPRPGLPPATVVLTAAERRRLARGTPQLRRVAAAVAVRCEAADTLVQTPLPAWAVALPPADQAELRRHHPELRLPGRLYVVPAASLDTAALAARALRLVARLDDQRARVLWGQVSLPVSPPPQWRRVLAERRRVAATLPALTAEQVAGAAGVSPRRVYDWHARGRALAYRDAGRLRFPAFQFGPDHRPLPAIAAIIEATPERHRAAWTITAWMTRPHPAFGGRTPADQMTSDPTAVVAAAARRRAVAPRTRGRTLH